MPILPLTQKRRNVIPGVAFALWWEDVKEHLSSDCVHPYALFRGATRHDYLYRAARAVIGDHVDGVEVRFAESAIAKLDASARSCARQSFGRMAGQAGTDDCRAVAAFLASHGK